MLKNDPPPGTPVKFVRQVRKANVSETASLVRSLQKYEVDRPSDQFEVRYKGELLIVERQDIERLG
jgi:hypothetical protein